VLHDAWIANEHSPGLRVYLAPTIVRAALLARDPQLARSIADGVEAYEQPGSVASARANVLLARGTVDRDRATLERAADAFRELGLPHELGIACETTAAVIAEQQDAASARPLFDEAVDIYARLDARRDTARTLATMRACGLRRGSRAAHRRALKGWESLTAMETDVVRLTVDGLTNRQIGERLFISRRTVQTHLAHAFTKLDVASRVELAAAAQRHASA
jgi:DNA-binding CsgD family transcriptional regulator